MDFIADVYSLEMLKVAADESIVASSERHNQLASRLALGESPGVLGKTLKDKTCKHSWTCAIAELEAAGQWPEGKEISIYVHGTPVGIGSARTQ